MRGERNKDRERERERERERGIGEVRWTVLNDEAKFIFQ
jgi:hypothetical protein